MGAAVPQGVVELISDYVVCTSGDTLTSNQAALLRVFDVKMAAFRMSPVGYWLAKGMSLLCIPQCVNKQFWRPFCIYTQFLQEHCSARAFMSFNEARNFVQMSNTTDCGSQS